MTKNKITGQLISIMGAVGVLLVLLSVVITNPNEYTVVKQFGKIVRVEDSPGVSFKIPFIQSTQSILKNVQIYDLAVSDVITKDKKSMVSDCFVLWKISDPQVFISTVNASVTTAEARINTTVYNALKNVISSTNQTDVISGRDGKLANAIRENVGNSLEKYGVELLSVETKLLDLPDGNKNAVYERMKSERNNIAASFDAEGQEQARIIRNGADAEMEVLLSEAKATAQRLVAEGEAEYMAIMKSVYDTAEKAEFYKFIIDLDATKKAYSSGQNKTLIIDKTSPFASIFTGN